MAKYKGRTSLGVVSIFFATLSAIAYQIVPSQGARLPILLIVPFVIWLASPDPVSSGGCVNCRAKRSKQKIILLDSSVKPSNQATSQKGEVQVEMGWDVNFTYQQICQNCKQTFEDIKDIYISKSDAPTGAQAVVLAKNLFLK